MTARKLKCSNCLLTFSVFLSMLAFHFFFLPNVNKAVRQAVMRLLPNPAESCSIDVVRNKRLWAAANRIRGANIEA